MNELLSAAAFYIIAFVILAAALGVVLGHDLIHSALLLTLSFIGVGCLYIFLDADFLGAAQFMVYAGGVAILIVLGIMLTRHKTGGETNPSNYHRWGALILSVLFVSVMLAAYQGSPLPASICSIHDTVDALADLMLMHYVLAFELAAVLLLAALVGAIVLAKGADEG